MWIAVVAIVVAHVELAIVVAVHVHGIAIRIKGLFCRYPSLSPLAMCTAR